MDYEQEYNKLLKRQKQLEETNKAANIADANKERFEGIKVKHEKAMAHIDRLEQAIVAKLGSEFLAELRREQ